MSVLNIFGNRNEEGKTDFPVVRISYDSRTPIEICCGDKELWITITTPEKEKYVLEVNCSMDEWEGRD